MDRPALDDVLRNPERLAALRRLQEFAAAAEATFARLARLAAHLFRAPVALVTLVDDERQMVMSSFGLPEPWASMLELPTNWGFCVPTLTGGKARLVAAVIDDVDFADDPAVADLGAVAVACVPLLDDAGLGVGVLTIVDSAPRTWDEEDQELVTFLAGSVMNELQLRAKLAENLRLVVLTRDAAEREALRARQLRGLAETTVVLATTLSLDERLRIVVERARDMIGAHIGAIWKQAEGSRSDVRMSFAVSEKYAAWPDREMSFPSDELYAEMLVTNQPIRLSADELEAHPPWAERTANGGGDQHPPLRGLLAAPIVSSDGDPRGVILLSDKADGEFTPEDEAIVVQLARTVSRTSERSQQYEREHEIATTLQQSFLPHELPEVPGLDLAARYLPGTVGLAVGGDWYDAITIGDRSVALVVGDVVGHGVRAAAIMGQLRNALRAYIHEGFRLAGVFERLDRLADSFGGGDFATVAVAELEPATGWLRWATAGQLPPLVIEPGGAGRFLEGPVAPPLGAGLPAVFVESTTQIEPGSTLVLYTDGLVERRTHSIDVGMERLRQEGEEMTTDRDAAPALGADGIAERLVRSLTAADRDDDIAVLVARLPSPDES
ncbi:MAG: SpoIIE family protein phosphatase [Acidimicrobiales bacterium]